jgi:hypothetical protein
VFRLDELFSLDKASDPAAVVEHFVARFLTERGVWSRPRESDGVEFCRVVECGATRARISGRIYSVSDQVLHSFWLDVERDAAEPQRATWTLHFDVDGASTSARLARNAAHLDDPGQVDWTYTLTGTV